VTPATNGQAQAGRSNAGLSVFSATRDAPEDPFHLDGIIGVCCIYEQLSPEILQFIVIFKGSTFAQAADMARFW
jgi:hypothetical protein